MLNNLKRQDEGRALSPVMPEPVSIADSTIKEEVVIYDECGDTLWDRVLSQEEKTGSPDQDKDSKAG